jgi:CubicO group peptidase (beta-lactamase class C family)
LELWHVPGVSVAVVDGEETYAQASSLQSMLSRLIFPHQGYGTASIPALPMTLSTLFYAGSTTKAFTVVVMSFLVDDNENYLQV